MQWKVLYGDWSEYSSVDWRWEDIPYNDVQKVYIIFPDKTKVISSGVDKYVVQEVGESLRLTYWKDENPEEGDPFFNMGRSRLYHNDNSITEDTGYVSVKKLRKIIGPEAIIKRGQYLDEETARAMGIL